jgi:hypothetical protein
MQEAESALGVVWVGAENVASAKIWSLDYMARSESLYQLCYPNPS